MSRTTAASSYTSAAQQRAQAIAHAAAERYFAALLREIPYDTAPGDVDLIDAANEIHAALLAGRDADVELFTDAALHAGYILGIEIGRRCPR